MAVDRKKPARKLTQKKPGEVLLTEADYEAMPLEVHVWKRNSGPKTKRKDSFARKPIATYTSRIRAIGNSKGVILNSQVIEAAGLTSDADIIIQAGNGVIYITQLKTSAVNSDLSTWDKQFKAAIRKGAKPEADMYEGLENEFDKKEW